MDCQDKVAISELDRSLSEIECTSSTLIQQVLRVLQVYTPAPLQVCGAGEGNRLHHKVHDH